MLQPGQDPDEVEFFDEQVEWELERLEIAWLIVIWMANSINPESTRMIGRTSRVEVGLNIGRNKKVVVGIEPGFPGERYLRKFCARFRYKVYSSLEEVCQAAINYFNRR